MPKNIDKYDFNSFMNAKAAGLAVINDILTPEAIALVDSLYKEGRAAWRWDPYVPGVVGFMRVEEGYHPDNAWLVVYTPIADGCTARPDVECSLEFEAML